MGDATGPVLKVTEIGGGGIRDPHEAINIVFREKEFSISLMMPEERIAPLFDGAAWAGTQLWEAAIEAIKYMEQHYSADLGKGASVIELGCGTGIPGMCCRLMGAKVLLTEQMDLVPLLNTNLASAFPGDSGISAATLSWERELAGRFAQEQGPFDFVLCCDCVFFPLYGDSWRLLAETLHALLLDKRPSPTLPHGAAAGGGQDASAGPRALPRAVVAVQRRNGDQIDDFIAYCRGLTPRLAVEEVVARTVASSSFKDVPIVIYEMWLHPA